MNKRDDIYDQPVENPTPFVFNEAVARVFPDMVKRSVPGYADVIAGTGLIAGDYAQAASNVYDLGCSVGASSLAMLQMIKAEDVQIIAVDNSPDMINLCNKAVVDHPMVEKLRCVCADIQDIEIQNASVVVLNYTLQFIPPDRRAELLGKIYQGMRDDGVLILSEKLAFDTEAEQQRQTALHESFKRAQGYSELEISQKRAALENVLVPESLSTHLHRLGEVGFRDAQLWFRSINFASMMAWK